MSQLQHRFRCNPVSHAHLVTQRRPQAQACLQYVATGRWSAGTILRELHSGAQILHWLLREPWPQKPLRTMPVTPCTSCW